MRKAVDKDWVDAYYTYGIDKVNRRIFLDGGIDAESCAYIRRGMLYLDSLSNEQKIELWICSDGGDEYGMFGIYDAIQIVKAPVVTVATGMCMSAAPLLVAAGKKGERYATPNAWFMIHQSWEDWAQSRIDEQKRLIKQFENMHTQWADLMAQHSLLTAKQWKAMCCNIGDSYFNANQALKYGIIDQIWSEKD